MMMTIMMTAMQIATTPPITPPMIGPMDWVRLAPVPDDVEIPDELMEGAEADADAVVVTNEEVVETDAVAKLVYIANPTEEPSICVVT